MCKSKFKKIKIKKNNYVEIKIKSLIFGAHGYFPLDDL